eukprot:6212771-Pleurochrysis_carterae.AAC.3
MRKCEYGDTERLWLWRAVLPLTTPARCVREKEKVVEGDACVASLDDWAAGGERMQRAGEKTEREHQSDA